MGLIYRDQDVDASKGEAGTIPILGGYRIDKADRGARNYELTNHLGNVLVTINDVKTSVAVGGAITSSSPTIQTANDYYPFGMLMPGRNYNAPSAKDYKFGFNGKENDDYVNGEGTQQDYGMRIYDPRLGKFLSLDPFTSAFPYFTPYQFAGNTPVWATDLDGGEPSISLPRWMMFPDAVLTLPKIPSIPLQPSVPAPPVIPNGFATPQSPTLPPAPFMPVPPLVPPTTRSTPIDESTIDKNDANTYPTPPFVGDWKVVPLRPGVKGYDKLKKRGVEATRLENENGDILRWHPKDRDHPKSHWDFKPGGSDNNEWQNWTPDGIRIPEGQIYGKDFNPPSIMLMDMSTFPMKEYPAYLKKQYDVMKAKIIEYNKKMIDYNKQMQEYDKKLEKYQQDRKKYDEKMMQQLKDHPENFA